MGVSERNPVVDGFTGIPWRCVHPHVTTPGNRQPDRSRRGGLRETPILWLPFLTGIQVTAARGSHASHTQAYAECYERRTQAYGERTQTYTVRSIDSHDFGNFGRLFKSFLIFSDSRILQKSPPVPRLAQPDGNLAISWQVRPLRVRSVRNSLVPPPRQGSPSCWTTWFTLRAPLLLRGPWGGCPWGTQGLFWDASEQGVLFPEGSQARVKELLKACPF